MRKLQVSITIVDTETYDLLLDRCEVASVSKTTKEFDYADYAARTKTRNGSTLADSEIAAATLAVLGEYYI